jgi:hypothetical protein
LGLWPESSQKTHTACTRRINGMGALTARCAPLLVFVTDNFTTNWNNI